MDATPAGVAHQILLIWEEVLSQEGIIKVDANFFEFGDSFAAYIMLSICERHFNVELELPILLENPTLLHFASKVEGLIQSRQSS